MKFAGKRSSLNKYLHKKVGTEKRLALIFMISDDNFKRRNRVQVRICAEVGSRTGCDIFYNA